MSENFASETSELLDTFWGLEPQGERLAPRQLLERYSVHAIVVAEEGDDIPAVLEALSQQTRPIDRCSLYIRGELSAEHRSWESASQSLEVHSCAGESFASILRRAVSEVGAKPENVEPPAGESAREKDDVSCLESPSEWIWILHGDCVPENVCLSELLHAASNDESNTNPVGILGPKQCGYTHRRRLLEVGIEATRTARRVPTIHADEYDQGQYDTRSRVLAVGSAGMLIRRDVLTEVGGFDDVLGPFGDGLEISRRVHLAGWNVRVVPTARVYHKRASYSPRGSFAERRGTQLYNALLAAPGFWLPFLIVGLPFLSLARSLARLLMKDPAIAWAELRGGIFPFAHLGALHRGRANLRRLMKASGRSRRWLRPLEASGHEVRKARRLERRARKEARALAHRPTQLELARRAAMRRRNRICATSVTLLALLVSLIAFMPVASTAITGGAMALDSWDLSEVLRGVSAGWTWQGDGINQPTDSFYLLFVPLLALGWPLHATLGGVLSIFLMLALPLAAFISYVSAASLTSSWKLRTLVSLIWAFNPPLLLALSHGQYAAAAWHIAAPAFFAAFMRMQKNLTSVNTGVASLAGLVLATANPASTILVLAMGIAGIISAHSRRLAWVWMPVPAIMAMAPAFLATAKENVLLPFLFSTPGANYAAHPSGLSLLLFNPGDTLSASDFLQLDVEFWARFAFLILLGLITITTLLRGRHAWAIRMAALAIPFGWIWAQLSMREHVGVTYSGSQAYLSGAWAGIGLSLAAIGVWIAILLGLDGLGSVLARYSFGLVHVIVLGAVALCIAAGGLQAVSWASTASAGLTRSPEPIVPALGTFDQDSAEHTRVLVLEPDSEGIHARILREEDTQLHATSMGAKALQVREAQGKQTSLTASDQDIAQALVDITTGEDPRPSFARHNIGMILVPADSSNTNVTSNDALISGNDVAASANQQATASLESSSPSGVNLARERLIAQISTLEGIDFVTDNERGAFWRIDAASSRVGWEKGSERQELQAGIFGSATVAPAGGVLTLSERADSAWWAFANGHRLSPVADTWYQAWHLPDEESTVVVMRSPLIRGYYVLASLAMIASFVLALPITRRRKVDA